MVRDLGMAKQIGGDSDLFTDPGTSCSQPPRSAPKHLPETVCGILNPFLLFLPLPLGASPVQQPVPEPGSKQLCSEDWEWLWAGRTISQQKLSYVCEGLCKLSLEKSLYCC